MKKPVLVTVLHSPKVQVYGNFVITSFNNATY
mgnify:CR=1 FL=1